MRHADRDESKGLSPIFRTQQKQQMFKFLYTYFLLIIVRFSTGHASALSVIIPMLVLAIFSQLGFIEVDFGYAQVEAGGQEERQFIANLTGQAELPSVVTNASGQATFTLNEDGDEVSYDLDVEDIEGATAAHIYWGNPQRNGPVLVTLFNESEPTDEIDGSLSDGDFTSEDFEVNLPARESLVWQSLGENMSSLITLMEEGRTYVNVHTQGFPTGEIRGTIQEVQELTNQQGNNNDDDNGDDDGNGD